MKTLVLYDGDCYLCKQTKRILQWLDWFQQLKWQPLQEYETNHVLTKQEREEIRGGIHIVKENGSKLAGFQAVKYMLLRTPLTVMAGLALHLPGADLVGEPVYHWIARNRYKLFKHKCSAGACKLS